MNFSGYLKKDFKEKMIDFWMEEGIFKTRQNAIEHYGGKEFDKLCSKKTLCFFKYDINTNEKECFEIVDNNFVIPVAAINIKEIFNN